MEPSDPFHARGFIFGGSPFGSPQPTTHPPQPNPPPTLSTTELQAMRLAETVLAQLKDNTNHMLCLTSATRDSTLSAEARGTALLQLKISAEVLLRVAEVASGYVGGAELRSAK